MLNLRLTSKYFRLLFLFTLLLLIDLLPLTYFSFLDLPYEFSKFITFIFLGSTLLILNGIYIMLTGRLEIPPRKIFLSLVLFLASYLVATIFSISRIVSVIGFYGFFTGGLIDIFLLAVVYYSAFLLRAERKLFLQSFFFSGVFVSFIGLWEYFRQVRDSGVWVYRIVSTIGQPNRLAFFLISILPLGFFLYTYEKHKPLKIIYAIGWLVTLLAFLLTFSRSSFFILVLLIGVFILTEGARMGRKINSPLLGFLIFCLIYFGLLFIRSIPSTIQNYRGSSLILRVAEWQGSLEAILNRNFVRQMIGTGPETTYFTFFKYRPVIYNQSEEEVIVGPGQIRNYYLHLLSGIGMIGLIFYLFFTKNVLLAAEAHQDLLGKGIRFSLLAIVLNSLFYYQTESVMLVFWVLAGLVSANIPLTWPFFRQHLSLRKTAKRRRMVSWKLNIGNARIFGFGFILIALGIFSFLIRLTWAHYLVSILPNENSLSKAITLNPYYDVYPRNLSKLYLQQTLAVNDQNKAEREKGFLFSQQKIKEALQISPDDIRNTRQLVLVNYDLGVQVDKKYHRGNLVWLQRLTAASPTDPFAWDMSGLTYLDLGRLDEAYTAFMQEKSLQPDLVGVYLHLGEVLKQQGKIDEAIKFYEKAVELSRDWDFARNELTKAQELKRKLAP